jgi:hypothetical protein
LDRLKHRIKRAAGRTAPRRQVLDLVPRGAVCAEVGVWKGNFSQRILEVVQPSELHLIDPWRAFGGDDYEGARYGGKLEQGQAEMDAVHESVLRRFAAERSAGVVHVHRMLSLEAAAALPDGRFDFVYIDGNHRYEFVRDDLAAFAPKLRPGGVLAGDDYGVEGWWENGVTRAVDEFVASGAAEVVLQAGTQFALRAQPPSASE